MMFEWFKHFMPRSLYGRAALILLLPVVTLQLVVSIVFIQRHFEGVTRQMTLGVLDEIQYLVAHVNDAPTLTAAQVEVGGIVPFLEFHVDLPGPLHPGDKRVFYDLSGRTVIQTLRLWLPKVAGIDLESDPREVRISLETAHGGMDLSVPRSRVSASNPHQLLVLMIFTGMFITLISFVFLRNQIRPIRALAKAAEAFGRGRVVDYKPSGASEVRAAGTAFLDMRNRIERQMEQRTMMLSGISHDLRTPLTRLKLAISMQPETDETEDMQRDVRDMQRLVDEFLAFARGDALDDLVEVDIPDLVRRTVARAARGGQNVTLGYVDETGPIQARPLAVSRALENLIGNAVRHGTRAVVGVDGLDRSVRIRVEDDGPGIPDDKRAEALKAFVRLDPSRNQNNSTGAGLGLAIASDIARKHGGTLHLSKSDTLGGLCADLFLAR